MKTVAGIGIFLVLGLLAAYVIGFQPDIKGELPYDEEFTGLKDRIIIKFSHVVAENTPKGLAAAHFAQLVKEKSQDRVEVQVFPNGMLYTEDTEIAALQHDDVQMIAPSFSNMNKIDPMWLVMDLPFLFQNQEEVDRSLQGALGQRLLATLEAKGLKGAAFWHNGFRQVTNNVRPLRTPEDFQGLKFRIQPSTVLERQFKALNASTISTPFNELYRTLETGRADGQENTISNILSKRLYQVQRFMTISNHGYLGYVVTFNKRFWENLPPDVQQLLQEALRETSDWNNRESLLHQNQLQSLLQNQSLQIITLSDEEKVLWKKRFEPLYEEFTVIIGKNLMNEIR
ncbi:MULTISPECIES: DctP family TRAP transporter solute-binding subunit [unclassified Paenibacillus]|uniref:DctP family TRAP transporter solute-binding subunit n=1 Tax=unclassified Paenibacillus TaxID=185978 RepID=UPI0021181834|nr:MULTISPECIES: DctP family TRAP transporter solute-binding subunit [unclassified Paenibacillus]